MCGRFTLVASPDEVAELFQVVRGLLEDDGPRFNIAPTQNVLTIRQTEAGREPSYLRWGLVPAWTIGVSLGVLRINARYSIGSSWQSSRRDPCRM
jgi:putative SOS response-associated peptidase YedK